MITALLQFILLTLAVYLLLLGYTRFLAQPTAATKDGVDPVRVGLTSRRRSLQSLKR
jgi:hypothetical protein